MFTRGPAPAVAGRRRGYLAVAAGLFILYLLLSSLATLWTDYLWFDSVGYERAWWRRVATGLGLGVAGVVAAFGVIWVNLTLADRFSFRYGLFTNGSEDDEFMIRVREWVEPRLRLVRLGGSALLAVLIGAGVARWRDNLLLFVAAQPFGVADPIFGNDVGFYVFRLALLSDLISFLFNLLATATVLVVASYFFSGGIRWRPGSFPAFTHGAKTHVSILLALLALVRAALYRLDAYRLLYSDRALEFYGPGYTEVNARLPALRLLMLIAVAAALVFLISSRRRGWTLAGVSAAAWALVSIGAGVIYPAVVERFQVQPNSLNRQQTYVAHNIEATRAAYGLEAVEVQEFAATLALESADIEANRTTIDNLRLWDPAVLSRTYERLQEQRQYYSLDRVDVDRYMIDGELSQVMVGVRELDQDNLPSEDWQNRMLSYSHGYGAVVSPANRFAPDGGPQFLLRDVPPVSSVPEIVLEQPRIYFGESRRREPVVVRTNAGEFDVPRGTQESELSEYDGADGVVLSSIWRRLAFALRYRDLNLAISGLIRPDSRVLMERNVRFRVQEVAPFLSLDADPYPVLDGGRLLWVLDLYTSSGRYPYSRPVDTLAMRRLARVSGLPSAGFNYIRNSVKATVDAYDGTITFYVVDQEDPVIAAWREVYPDLFVSGDLMPAGLQEHLRYPQDLLKIQSEIYLDYHMTDVGQFFRKEDSWSIPEDPSDPRRLDRLNGDLTDPTDLSQIIYLREVLPYYLLMRLPGAESPSYVLLQPLNPEEKPTMASFLLGEYRGSGEAHRLVDIRLPPGSAVPGLKQVGERIESEDAIAAQFSLWRGKGSDVILGDMLVVPVEESLLYVQPVYLADERGSLPKFQRVVIAYGNEVAWDESIDQALQAIFGDGIAGPEPSQPTTDLNALLREAAARFEQAEAALRAGNLAEYQRLIDEARTLVESALEQVSGLEAGSRPRIG